MVPLSAWAIKVALDRRYRRKYVTFCEVKDGATYGRKHRQIDFLAIKKTWKPVTIAAFEIKISRNDFLSDKKWVDYLPLCNEFYWVCPTGLISKDEVDERAGLIYVSDQGGCRTVKRAVYRDVDPDPHMLLYLLLWRETGQEKQDTREFTMAAIKREMAERAGLGKQYRHYVAKVLTEVRKRLSEIDREKRDLERQKEALGEWQKLIDKGFPFERLQHMVDEFYRLPARRQLCSDLRALERSAEAVRTLLEAAEGESRP